MIKSFKVRLLPTKEQEELMFKSIGYSRFAYNWGINKVQEYREQGKKYSMSDIRKDFTQLKKQYSSLPASRVSFMIADGYEREPAVFDFDEFGNFLRRF